jgi:hypothetical protein
MARASRAARTGDGVSGPDRPPALWGASRTRLRPGAFPFARRTAADIAKLPELCRRGISPRQISHRARGGLRATAQLFRVLGIAPNPNARFKRYTFEHKNRPGGLSMTIREKLNLAGLCLALTATFAWIGLLGFGISEAIRWLL